MDFKLRGLSCNNHIKLIIECDEAKDHKMKEGTLLLAQIHIYWEKCGKW